MALITQYSSSKKFLASSDFGTALLLVFVSLLDLSQKILVHRVIVLLLFICECKFFLFCFPI